MNTVILELPLDALALPGIPPEDLVSEAQFMLVLKLFEIGRLSSGKAARLYKMRRVAFFPCSRAGLGAGSNT